MIPFGIRTIMTDYVTVVSVDNGAQKLSRVAQQLLHLPSNSDTNKAAADILSIDSPFITVLSINNSAINNVSTINTAAEETTIMPSSAQKDTTQEIAAAAAAEEVIVYRLPGERLGFGLKFQGGTRNAENIQKLFIQSCAVDSPASRASTSWGHLREGDEIIEIDGTDIRQMTRLECVRCLKESQLAIRLWVRNSDGKSYAHHQQQETLTADGQNFTAKQRPTSPPPVPPRKIYKRKSLTDKIEISSVAKQSNEKSFTPPPDAEFYINLFSGNIRFCIISK